MLGALQSQYLRRCMRQLTGRLQYVTLTKNSTCAMTRYRSNINQRHRIWTVEVRFTQRGTRNIYIKGMILYYTSLMPTGHIPIDLLGEQIGTYLQHAERGYCLSINLRPQQLHLAGEGASLHFRLGGRNLPYNVAGLSVDQYTCEADSSP